jgi:biotin carboxylase
VDRKTVFFVGAGRHQLRAIVQARELGLGVVAVDRDPDAPGLAGADFAEVVDFRDAAAVIGIALRQAVDGVLTISTDRAVPVVAAVAEAVGLPGIGAATAHLMTHKVAMRRRLAEHGIPQPRFAAVRTLAEARLATEAVGFPAVLKPADSGGQRGVFRLESRDDLDRHLHTALIESPAREAILESYHEGLELNGIAVARHGEVSLLTLSDRLRPPGVGFGVGWVHVYPTTLFGDRLEQTERTAAAAVAALGLEDGVALPQLLATEDDGVLVVEVSGCVPGGQMADLVRYAIGLDIVEIALRQALGEEIADELVTPRFQQPLAIRFLTAEPGLLPAGIVRRVGGLERVLDSPGIVQADVFLTEGETIRPVRLDGDRRGYVIAVASTNVEALDRADSAARLLEVEVVKP